MGVVDSAHLTESFQGLGILGPPNPLQMVSISQVPNVWLHGLCNHGGVYLDVAGGLSKSPLCSLKQWVAFKGGYLRLGRGERDGTHGAWRMRWRPGLYRDLRRLN